MALFAADPRAKLLIADARLAGPCAIIIGREGSGVRPELAARATGVKIPTVNVESLNAAVAAGMPGKGVGRP